MLLRAILVVMAVGLLPGACTLDRGDATIERMQRNQRAAMETAA
jgi:hypothetical protein